MSSTSYKVTFETKQVSAIQTVAELLRYAREEQKITIEELAEQLQISNLYLEALENGDYGRLPSLIYTRNFVKKFGLRVNLDLPALLEMFEEEWHLFEKMQQPLLDIPSSNLKKTHFWKMPRWFRWAGASLLILTIVGYLGVELYQLNEAPILTLHTPNEESILDKQVVEVVGQTDPEAILSINDQVILSDVEGKFSELVALQPGLNIIEIEARKKYSRPNTLFRKILVEPQTTFSSSDTEPPVS